MATNFMTLNSEKQEPKKTVFEKQVNGCLAIDNALWRPDEFKNVLYLGNDKYYGDVFKAWNDNKNDFFILFGTAGDEFKK
jgi:hypothetical protein